MNDIRTAYQASGLTMAEISRCLRVPERTLQDWIYGKRTPRRSDIPERIKILSVLSPEERAEINWPEAIRLYKIRTAASNADGTFEKFIGLVPETVLDQVDVEGLTDAVNALHRAYEEGRKTMKNDERYFFERFEETKNVSVDNCYAGGHNCGTCMYCRWYDTHEFGSEYCIMARKEGTENDD